MQDEFEIFLRGEGLDIAECKNFKTVEIRASLAPQRCNKGSYILRLRASPLAPDFGVSANVSDWLRGKNRKKVVYLTVL